VADDPLAGLPRPLGDAATITSIGSRFVSGAQVLGHTSQMLVQMTGRALAQAWSGAAAMSCAAACARNAALVATSADAYEAGGNALRNYGSALASAQADWDHARRLADQALSDEAEHQHRVTMGAQPGALVSPLDLFYVSPLRATARSIAQDAIDRANRAGKTAAAALEGTLRPFLPKPAPPKKAEHHWYSPVTGFLGGAWDGVKDPVVMVGGLMGLHGDFTDNWSNLGHGLAHGITHPLTLGKALIDWDDFSKGHYAHWAGNLVPSIAAAWFSGGAAAGAKGIDGIDAATKASQTLEELSEADKAALLARGEPLVAGSVGSEVPGALNDAGRLDYAKRFEEEIESNFGTVTKNGTEVLDSDRWLVNVHDASAPLSGGRSLKYAANLDEVLGNSRGGFLDKLALVPQWGSRDEVSILHIPAGTEIHIAEGTTAPQVSHLTIAGKDLGIKIGSKAGGAMQTLFQNVDRDWVVWTGKAPWPSTATIVTHAATGAGVVRVADALADVSRPNQ
jgi:uncharacterized protein YukE